MRTRSSSRVRPQRRKLVWSREAVIASTFFAANATVAIPLLASFSTNYGADPIGCTVMRVRGRLGFRSSVAGNAIRAAVGIGVFPQTITTTSNLSPAPGPGAHLDWMYWSMVLAEPVIATEFATVNLFEVDVRARRKMEELSESLFLCITNVHTADVLNYSYSMSTLLALP